MERDQQQACAVPYLTHIKAEAYDDYHDSLGDQTPLPDALQSDLASLEHLWNETTLTDAVVGTLAVASSDSWVAIEGKKWSLPLSVEQAADLYQSTSFQSSRVGVENVGTVLDAKVRQSKEYVLNAATDLCPLLQTLDNTELLSAVHLKLAPSAERVTAVPYKVLGYGPGDFFSVHCDAMDRDATMFGSLALQVPVIGVPPDPQVKRRREEEGVPTPGSLLLYVGRSVASSVFGEKKVGLLTNGTATGEIPYSFATEHAYQLRYELDLTSTDTTLVTPGSVELKYAAWYGDVPHEVVRVENGYRFVMIYKLFRQGQRLGTVPPPLTDQTDALLRGIFNALREGPHTERYVGCLLRHKYPPAGLHSSSLKGVDAMVHHVVSRHYRTSLFTAMEARADYPMHPFRLKSCDVDDDEGNHFRRRIFLTNERKVEGEVDLSSARAARNVTAQYPMFTNTVWVQVGLGKLVGGGAVYGNWDCGTDWWYRAAVLLVHPEPSRWQRSRGLYLAALKGGEQGMHMRRLYESELVWRTVCSFI